MPNPLISIVIPVYNAEKYLRQCLDSVVAQEYTNWECILIDDGSKDYSGNICDEYVENDSRFKVFHKGNDGVSIARNIGIEYSNGEWIYFCDADDYVYPNGLEIFVNHITKDIDLIMAGHERFSSSGRIMDNPPKPQSHLIEAKAAIASIYKQDNFDYEGYLWDKLFRRECIVDNNILFNKDISFKEDSLFCIQYICASRKNVYYTTEIVYRYFLNDTSAMAPTRAGYYNPKHWTSLDAHLLQFEVIKKMNIDSSIITIALDKMYYNLWFNRNLMRSSNCFDKQLYESYRARVFMCMTTMTKYRCIIRYTLIGRAINKFFKIMYIKTI